MTKFFTLIFIWACVEMLKNKLDWELRIFVTHEKCNKLSKSNVAIKTHGRPNTVKSTLACLNFGMLLQFHKFMKE